MARRPASMTVKSQSTYLLDANVLIALAWPVHVHHTIAHDWFERQGHLSWSTCPLTQLAFVRISSNARIISGAVSPRGAVQALAKILALTGHVFWPDNLQVGNLPSFSSKTLVGHRQVTDAYLLELAKHQNGKLATLDAGLADLLPQAERDQYVTLIGA